jgi:hypothetical protein
MPQKISEEKIKWIKELRESGNSYDSIRKITKSSKRTVKKICDPCVKNTYPSVKIPEGMKETQYPGYYITEDGRVYRKPGRCDVTGIYGEPDENGLIYLKPGLRGNPKYPQHHYECVNISIWDNNGKYLKRITKSIHQLVAEVFVPNPEGHNEILHIDENNRNNHYKNLKWGTHQENMKMVGFPEGAIREHKRYDNSRSPTRYIKKDGEWILIPNNRPPWNKGLKGSSWNTLPNGTVTTRKVNGSPAKFIKQNDEWIYQRKNPKRKSPERKNPKKEPLPDGTISIRADGTTWIKKNGKWVYQKKKKFPRPTKILQNLKILYNFEKGKLQYLI